MCQSIKRSMNTNEGLTFYEILAKEPGFKRKKSQNSITVNKGINFSQTEVGLGPGSITCQLRDGG